MSGSVVVMTVVGCSVVVSCVVVVTSVVALVVVLKYNIFTVYWKDTYVSKLDQAI